MLWTEETLADTVLNLDFETRVHASPMLQGAQGDLGGKLEEEFST